MIEKNIASLQVGRGLAALMVVFYHVYLIMMQAGHTVYEPVAMHGILGVNFFFVLSGFIILMAHERDIGQSGSIPRYVYRRFVRIFPIYWVYFLIYIGAAAIGLGSPDFLWDPAQLASAATLFHWVPLEGTLPLKVAWTLFYEVKFYLIFILLLVNRTLGLAAFVAWLGIMLFVPSSNHGVNNLDEIASLWSIHFIFGMAAFWLTKRIDGRHFWLFLLGGLALLGLFMQGQVGVDIDTMHHHRDAALPLLAFGFTLLLMGGVMAEKKFGLRMPRVLSFGDASYSIYLVHSMAISAAVIIGRKLDLFEKVGTVPVFWLTFVGATVAGCVGYVLLEKPLLKKLRRK